MTDLFGQIKSKMLKMSECYTSLADSFDHASRFALTDPADMSKVRGNRLGNLYKYMVTMFNEWAINFKQNESSFESLLASSNKHSLLVFSGMHDVAWADPATEDEK